MIKMEKDQERRKMKEDIQKKMREMRSKEVKFEIVGVPDFMNP